MTQLNALLSSADHERISAAVAAAEARSSGEIVTILTEQSDGYTDVALAWAALVAFTALTVLSIAPDFYLGLFDRITGQWHAEWTPRAVFTVAACAGIAKFLSMLLLQLWKPLKFWLIPGAVKSARVRARALTCFRVGAERRTTGRTGILIYLSMQEHRAEIVCDEAISTRVSPEVWGDAMAAMLVHIRDGRIADGMITCVELVGAVLAEHLPRQAGDIDELPNRLIEI